MEHCLAILFSFKVSDNDNNKKETKIDIPPPSPPDGNSETIDVEVLYDNDKCDLTKYDVDTVYKLLEYVYRNEI